MSLDLAASRLRTRFTARVSTGGHKLGRVLLALLVVLVHALPLLLLLPKHAQPAKKPPVNVSVLDPYDFIEKGANASGLQRCKYTYHGFGWRHAFDGVVTEIARGYAADRAGLRVGDEVTDYPLGSEDGWLVWRRTGVEMRARVKRETICQG